MKKVTIALIRLYQLLSPLWRQLLLSTFGVEPTCRFKPTCSEYAISQIQKHGTIKGLIAAWRQIKQCHV